MHGCSAPVAAAARAALALTLAGAHSPRPPAAWGPDERFRMHVLSVVRTTIRCIA